MGRFRDYPTMTADGAAVCDRLDAILEVNDRLLAELIASKSAPEAELPRLHDYDSVMGALTLFSSLLKAADVWKPSYELAYDHAHAALARLHRP